MSKAEVKRAYESGNFFREFKSRDIQKFVEYKGFRKKSVTGDHAKYVKKYEEEGKEQEYVLPPIPLGRIVRNFETLKILKKLKEAENKGIL